MPRLPRSRVLPATTALALALGLAACSGSTPGAPAAAASTPAGPASPSASTAPAGPAPAGPRWPLTGTAQPAGAPRRAALVVKVEDSVDARPQTGLNSADLVFEELVEGGITRFAAVYHSTLPATVGPVRSVRPMDAPVSDPLHALFAYSGGIPPFVTALHATSAQDVGATRYAAPYRREGSRPAPHNLYADPAKLYALADTGHRTPPPAMFRYAADAGSATAAGGAAAAHLTLGFSSTSQPGWTWDASGKVWLRDESGRPATTLPSGRISAANVVVLRVGEHATGYVDPAGNPVPEAEVVGRGTALVASGGRTVPATWSKPSRSAPFTLTAADGTPLLLAPGRTWVELVPTQGSVSTR